MRAGPMQCIHVRHGDAKAFQAVYMNRGVFDFSHYFDKLLALEDAPNVVFVASDAVDIDQQINKLSKLYKNSKKYKNNKHMPTFIQHERFLNQYGSHVIAARMHIPEVIPSCIYIYYVHAYIQLILRRILIYFYYTYKHSYSYMYIYGLNHRSW